MNDLNKAVSIAAGLCLATLRNKPASDLYGVIRQHCGSSFSTLIKTLEFLQGNSGYENSEWVELIFDLQQVFHDEGLTKLCVYMHHMRDRSEPRGLSQLAS